ncbi:NADH-dependent flavin oxidoreductase [Pseudomonas entomophila]|uniref:NADH-dependent flavin oxidoreductase n=1 Tax=Pseudomonas entomophila TaxID=312306 RepID=UPI001EFFC54B|nr:NADH-dependent flavin oxidoreductase [Pseudomonas entomophila]MCG8291337.1 NADH-dependent flavin oxidoreductase [Pseudomonas entomophila]
MNLNYPEVFRPLHFANGLSVDNRLAMAPMTTWSANADASISEQELAYYRRRVQGVGLVITGCTHVSVEGIGFDNEFAAWDDRFLPSLRRLAQAAKSGGAPAVLQIFHAGNKAIAEQTPDGQVVSASAVRAPAGPFNSGIPTPRALTEAQILAVVEAFAQATRRAIEAGFDGVELHGAHGFLIQNFLSPATNQRDDQWGGSLENRMRFPLALVQALQQVVREHASRPFLIGYRISLEEAQEGGLRIDDALALVERLAQVGIDYLHVSLYDLLNATPLQSEGEPQAPAALTIVRALEQVAGRMPVIAAGQITTPEQAEAALALGVSMVGLGRGLVINPDWVALAREGKPEWIAGQLDARSVPEIDVPDGLWRAISATPGWFAVRATETANN